MTVSAVESQVAVSIPPFVILVQVPYYRCSIWLDIRMWLQIGTVGMVWRQRRRRRRRRENRDNRLHACSINILVVLTALLLLLLLLLLCLSLRFYRSQSRFWLFTSQLNQREYVPIFSPINRSNKNEIYHVFPSVLLMIPLLHSTK